MRHTALLALIGAMAVAGCAAAARQEIATLSERCGAVDLTRYDPDFSQPTTAEQIRQQIDCIRSGAHNGLSIQGSAWEGPYHALIDRAEQVAVAVHSGRISPDNGQWHYNIFAAQVRAAVAAEERQRQIEAANALAIFGQSMQQAGAAMQQSRITPFTCTSFGNMVQCR